MPLAPNERIPGKLRPFLSWGELLWDLFPDGARLGGAAANLAYHLALLGRPAYLVSRVGQDPLGRNARQQLASAGVHVDFVELDPVAPTGTVEVTLHDGEPSYRVATEVAWDRMQVSRALRAALGRAQAIAFGTLAQRTPASLSALARACECLPADCLRLCDLNLRPPFVDLAVIETALCLATVVKLNETELATLSAAHGSSGLDWLLSHPNIELVAVTLGQRGSEFHSQHGATRAPGHPLSGAEGDRVGAGDAFAAVLMSDLVEGRPLAQIARRANRYAAQVASAPGGMPDSVRPPELGPDVSWRRC